MLPAMETMGARFKNGDLFLPEVLLSARALNAALTELEPLMAVDGKADKRATVLIGTVRGDMHDIGKNGENGKPVVHEQIIGLFLCRVFV